LFAEANDEKAIDKIVKTLSSSWPTKIGLFLGFTGTQLTVLTAMLAYV